MEAKPVSQSIVIMTELVLPSHTNALNSAFGGIIVSWIDIAAAICAQRHCQKPVVTASIDAMNFVNPVYAGWIVNIRASANFVSRSSMEIGVRVDAENPSMGETFHVASAYLTFVALMNGKPTPIPKLITETPAEIRRHAAAEKRRASRLALRAAQQV